MWKFLENVGVTYVKEKIDKHYRHFDKWKNFTGILGEIFCKTEINFRIYWKIPEETFKNF